MAYRFRHIEHQVYRNTFLKDVRIAVKYPKVDVTTVDTNRIQTYFTKFEGANIKVEDFLGRGNINIFAGKHDIDFWFSLDYAEVKLNTPPYRSFEAAWSYWVILVDFLNALGVQMVDNLTVRKFNALYFKSSTRDYDIHEVMGSLFCDELMGKIPADVSKDSMLNSFELTWKDSDDESRTEVVVVYGIKKADSIEKNDHLTLVTLVKSKDDAIPVSDVLKRATDYNQILFDLFHWCVKEDIINSMK